MEAAKLSDLPDGENFTMADFTYANSAVVSRMFAHLVNTSFPGISVSVKNIIIYSQVIQRIEKVVETRSLSKMVFTL